MISKSRIEIDKFVTYLQNQHIPIIAYKTVLLENSPPKNKVAVIFEVPRTTSQKLGPSSVPAS